KDSSEALAKPSSDLSEITVRPCLELPRMPRFDMFEMSVLRIDQEPGRNRKRRGLRLRRQPAKSERPADAHGPAKNLGGKLGDAGHLRGAAAQDDARGGLRQKGKTGRRVPAHFKNPLDGGADVVGDRGAEYDLRNPPIFAPGRRH